MDGYGTWGIDPDLDLIAADIDDHDRDVISDHDLLVAFAAEDEHVTSMSRLAPVGSANPTLLR